MSRLLGLCIVASLSMMGAAGAAEKEKGAGAPSSASPLAITDAHLVQPMGAGRPTAIFFTVNNTGTVADRLTIVKTPKCGRAEIHSHLEENGVMKMRKVSGMDVPAGAVTKLEPMGYHVMCFDPKQPLKSGTTFDMTLVFNGAGTIKVTDGTIIRMSDMADMQKSLDAPMAPPAPDKEPANTAAPIGESAMPMHDMHNMENMTMPMDAAEPAPEPSGDDFHQHDQPGHPAL